MFAGPNGSGKSTLQHVVDPHLLGYYLNADDLQFALLSPHGFDLSTLPINITAAELENALEQFTEGSAPVATGSFIIQDGRLRVDGATGMGYHAAATADLLRRKLLLGGHNVSFETVMSHPSKIDFLREAHALGYKTYLYYISTDDPDINVSRVKSRVQFGGHDVPEQKIRDRYSRSMSLLAAAIQNSDRAYIFDNSVVNEDRVWIAEFEGEQMELKIERDRVPNWFYTYVLRKLM